MTLPNAQNDTPLGTFGVSLIRTYVPVAWGAVIGYLITLIPALEPLLADPDTSNTLTTLIVGASIALWYLLARLIEPRLPAMVTRLIIGANARPTYLGGPEGTTQARITRSAPERY